MSDVVRDVVEGRFFAPELGQNLPSPIQLLEIAPSLAGRERALVERVGLSGRLAVVADQNTMPVMGRRVHEALERAELVVLDHPKADEATAAQLQDRVAGCDHLIAVGSGTINDLCKYVSHRTGRACAVFGTAASMDGYVTTTVSITRGGYKLTLPAQAPRGVFFDLEVMAAAPEFATLAGFGDTICRSVCQVDWLLSHLLLDTVYAETPYAMMAADEQPLYELAGRLKQGDQAAVLQLVRLSVLSGCGVLVTGTSHCGSMGEHQISHYIDMLLRPHPGTLHGQQVGIATWTMARLQARYLASDTPPVLAPLTFTDAELARRYGELAGGVKEAIGRKPFDPAATARMNRRLQARWPEIRQKLLAVMLPLERMEDAIARAGMPRTAAEIGIDPAFYRQAVRHALEIRDRYGFLDLAAQAGGLDGFAAEET
ncbi:MAG TPA: sn-glycerol-1-phosphate dehydrogenase [Geminicoccus sp.]|uniref:sn-glycerol-1-phosphate dehydrogenase n=1 Tax=Geminicoccus sp. TaxID=2024832 RepID=UPI002BAF5F0E|nr:sn-glycerol-1-phosphate dehydrogenase [Geminicoccus sp.]HWL68420.1 sn-glycerol-1-phosphate dehydrogenase [Geminicoccus sp.]